MKNYTIFKNNEIFANTESTLDSMDVLLEFFEENDVEVEYIDEVNSFVQIENDKYTVKENG